MVLDLIIDGLLFIGALIYEVLKFIIELIVYGISRIIDFVLGTNKNDWLRDGESIIYRDKGRYLFGQLFNKEKIDGTIIVTNQRFIFESETFLYETPKQVVLFFHNIESVGKKRIKVLFRQGVEIRTRDGTTFLFQIKDRENLLKTLNQVMFGPAILKEIKEKINHWKREGYDVGEVEELVSKVNSRVYYRSVSGISDI